MKKLVTLVAACAVSAAAHAELIAPKGAKATLRVEYTFTSKGDVWTPPKDAHDKWEVRRSVVMTAIYAADAPQAFGVMHANDGKQKQQMKQLEGAANATMAKMQPTMADMMKIVQDCGGGDSKESQACIEKKVSNYGNNMSDAQVDQMKSAGGDVTALSKMASGKRFQMWRMTSHSGSYLVDESRSHQVFEMTCTATQVCKRDTTIKGSGELPLPPGVSSVAGASLFEVDAEKQDLVLQLPVPLAQLGLSQKVVTTIPGETGGDTRTVMKPWMMQGAKTLTIPVPADLQTASGQKEFAVEGREHEGGLLEVTWRFSQQQ